MRIRLLLIVATLLAAPLGATAAPEVVTSNGDASIAHDTRAGTWTIAAGGTTLTLAAGAARDFAATSLVTSSGQNWLARSGADSTLTIDGVAIPFGALSSGWVYGNAVATTDGDKLQFEVSYDFPPAALHTVRHYAVVSGSPTFETWTTLQALGSPAAASNLNAFQLSIGAGTVHWLTGLQGDNADVANDSAFTLQEKTLAVGDRLALGAQGRSSETTVPWFSVDGAQDEFYAGLMWSGAWSLTLNRSATGLSAVLGLASMTTTIGTQPVDGPHAAFGVVPGGSAKASAALRSYILRGIRQGRPMTPLVTYNTWFAYGTEIDEASMRDEMTHAAALGAELFVIDAGWYAGVGASGPFDFDSGLGSWAPDPTRFPGGLKPLTEYAHSLGMKFGIWVEPERVSLSLVGAPGVEESWLATTGDHYGSDHAAQICLASAAARQWLVDRLTTLLDDVRPDYLKWDNNFWINCDRDGHGHAASDGNFAHVKGLYDVLDTLRTRYPSLLIENVSGGGNRLDLGMLRYSDSGWMDDRTAPSVHVRHNVEGLSAVFPPAYLLSFVTDHAGEPLHDSPDLPLYFRSRMVGTLGLCFRSADLADADATSISNEIALYRQTRDTLAQASGALLSPQAAASNGPAWDVLQETAVDGTKLIISAFQSDAGVTKVSVKPTGLDARTIYEVRSADTGLLGSATGADLMAQGIDVMSSPTSAAHLLAIRAKQP